MAIYTLPQPFETVLDTRTKFAQVVAYDDKSKRFIAVFTGGEAFSAPSYHFNPQPPIPDAAKPKPEIGQVWIGCGGALIFLAFHDKTTGRFLCAEEGGLFWGWHSEVDSLFRTATAEEAEPFRHMLRNLKNSLGEA